jgi:hypothetical protein
MTKPRTRADYSVAMTPKSISDTVRSNIYKTGGYYLWDTLRVRADSARHFFL